MDAASQSKIGRDYDGFPLEVDQSAVGKPQRDKSIQGCQVLRKSKTLWDTFDKSNQCVLEIQPAIRGSLIDKVVCFGENMRCRRQFPEWAQQIFQRDCVLGRKLRHTLERPQ